MDFINFITTGQLFYEEFWQQLVLAGVLFAIVFAFQAIALNVIAKREGYKNRWMAFIPFLSTYYIGVCAQKNKVMGISSKKFAIFVTLTELIAVAGYLLFYSAQALVSDFLIEEVYTTPYEFLPVQVLTDYAYSPLLPNNLKWATYVFDYGNYFLMFIELAYYILTVFLLISFFKTYAPRNYYLFSIVSILFPVKGIFAFAVRENKGKSYADYIRGEREKQYRMHQQYYQQYYRNSPYDSGYSNANSNGANPYNQNAYNQNQSAPPAEEPFGDFSSNGNSNGVNGDFNCGANSQSTPPPQDPFEDF